MNIGLISTLIFSLLQAVGFIVYFVTDNPSFIASVWFAYSISFLSVELYKLTLRNKILDSSGSINKYLFGEGWKNKSLFFRKSIITARGSEKIVIIASSLGLLTYSVLYLIFLFSPN